MSDSSSLAAAFKVVQPYVFGGLSGIVATTVVQPIDMIKVRIQIAGEGVKGAGASPFALASQIIKQDGFGSLYRGISAAWLRQATYTTARMGLFNTFMDALKPKDGKPIGATERAIAGLAAGGLGAVVGTPADLALVRMQSDGMLPPEQRRNYKGVGNALVRITREEGVSGLFRGCLPTVTRAMALNLGMLAGYAESKDRLTKAFGAGAAANFGASAIAGFFASFFSLPFDFVKTRMQKQKPGPDGVMPYKGSLDCAAKVLRNEGPLSFYRGFPTYYVRIAPHAMIVLLVNDWMVSTYKRFTAK